MTGLKVLLNISTFFFIFCVFSKNITQLTYIINFYIIYYFQDMTQFCFYTHFIILYYVSKFSFLSCVCRIIQNSSRFSLFSLLLTKPAKALRF
uniref:Hypothetical secreted protein n=1 Tax=Glossina morsitans morsitans TaxID=37546 RepID=D3TSP3_GLOMM